MVDNKSCCGCTEEPSPSGDRYNAVAKILSAIVVALIVVYILYFGILTASIPIQHLTILLLSWMGGAILAVFLAATLSR